MSEEDQNITMEEELFELESYIQALWTFFPLPMAYLNPIGIIMDLDDALAELLGLPKEDVIGEHLASFFLQKEAFSTIEKKTAAQGFVKEHELTLKGGGSKEVPVNVFTMARKNENNDMTGYFAALIDLSHIKRMQGELQQKVRELEQFHDLAVGRELKMIELEKENKRLRGELGVK